jgi:hypothetical protein
LDGEYFATAVPLLSTANDKENEDTIYLRLRRIGNGGPDNPVEGSRGPWWQIALLLATASSLLFALVGMQVGALVLAVTHLRDTEAPIPEKVWCSPGFQLANGNTDAKHLIFDGTCSKNHTVSFNSQGTGCINLPGEQILWLQLTVAIISVQLLLQAVDVYLLQKYQNTGSWMRMTPICTMAMGVTVWTALTVIAGFQSRTYPLMSHVVAINAPQAVDCQIFLTSAGLRGEIIAWSDGVFQAFKFAYFGPLGYEP